MNSLCGSWVAMALAASCLFGGPMTARDRQRLVAHLEMTESWLEDEIAGLSAAQMEFRSGEGAWTVKDVVEHLAVTEAQYWADFKASMAKAVAAEKPETADDAILWYGIDRTNRQKTGEAREPKGQFESGAKAFDTWKKMRGTMREYAGSTDEDLRGHRYLDSEMDVYQWLLMISTHSQRHILQVREIRHDSKFPKK